MILSFDVEANGLHGPAFAVGAMLIRADGEIQEEFTARCPIKGEIDPWVKENVLPAMEGVENTHSDAESMRRDFWNWFKQAQERSDYVLVSNGYPVEYRFLIDCQDDDLDSRYWEHPFPLLDLSAMLIMVGVKPLAVRYKFVEDMIHGQPVLQHNPRWDAWVSALAAIRAWRMAKIIS